MKVALVPLGPLPPNVLEILRDGLAAYGIVGEVRREVGLPVAAYDARRRQYRAEPLLDVPPGGRGDRVLAVTAEDIFAEGLNFVFGLADIGGTRAVISTFRLRSPDEGRFRERVLKEGVHELGHTVGIGHCSDPACVMSFSNSLDEADAKGAAFCESCRSRLSGAT